MGIGAASSTAAWTAHLPCERWRPGGYTRNRVFFADAETAVAAGYRPCAVCLPDEYRAWKQTREVALAMACDSP